MIKNLAALIPQMEQAYNDLNLIHNGSEAMQNMSQDKQKAYQKALLEYCKLDTLALVLFI